MESTTTTSIVTAAVGMNMQAAAEQQTAAAANYGVALDVKTTVYVNDGSKDWPSTLATVLCEKPELAKGSRQEMADIVTTSLALPKPFDATRLSKKLSGKAVSIVTGILKRFGYSPTKLERGMDIRDTVAAGNLVTHHIESTITTKFEVDGIWFGDKWYPYECFVTYETGRPWYFLGIRFAGSLIQLKTVLAMREIGINQFIGLDEAAHGRAAPDQLTRRNALASYSAVGMS